MVARAETTMRARRAAGRAWVLLAACALTHAGRARAQTAGEASVDQARRAYEEGVAAIEAGRFREAADALERSYALRSAPVVLYNLGLAYRGLGRHLEAIDRFNRYLETPDGQRDPRRPAIVAEVQRLERTVVVVDVAIDPPGATLRIDGRPQPTSGTLRLDPGAHAVEISAPGYRAVTRELRYAEGAHVNLTVALGRDGAQAPAETPRPTAGAPQGGAVDGTGVPAERPARGGGLSPLVFVGAGVAVAAAGVATYLGLEGNAIAERYNTSMQCPGMMACDSVSLQSALDTRALVVNVLWGAAAVGVAVTAIGVVTSLSSGAEQPRARAGAQLLVAPNHAGVRLVF